MYNDPNVQPQISDTGRGGSDNGDLKAPTNFVSPNELPAPIGNPVTPPPAPPSASITATSSNETERWVNEVEQLFAGTAQAPKKRADELTALRARYQQNVLGLKPMGREG